MSRILQTAQKKFYEFLKSSSGHFSQEGNLIQSRPSLVSPEARILWVQLKAVDR